MVEGQGYRFDPAALVTFAESTSRLTGLATEARNGLRGGRDLPAGVFGEVGDSSGFLAAFTECTQGLLTGVEAVGHGLDGLATAVRAYCEDKLTVDEDAASGLRRAENV